MPEPNKFLSGYQLKRGMNLSGWMLTDVTVSHKKISSGKYQYLTIMKWTPLFDYYPERLITALTVITKTDRIIESGYGNPYMCHFGTLRWTVSGRSLIVTAEGNSIKI